MSLSDVGCQTIERNAAKQLIETLGPDVNLQNGCPTNMQCPSSQQGNKKLLYHDWVRTAHVGITGLTFSGPISHAWYGILERIVTIRHYYGGLLIRMILDAVLFSPIAVGGYFTWRGILEGKEWHGIIEKLELKWANALFASWSFWPAANIM